MSRSRRGLMVGVLVAALLLLVPGGVFAWRALDGGGPQPHDVLPAEAIGYVRLDLDPSAEQKVEAFRFLRKFPAIEDAVGALPDDADLRERLIDEFATANGCDFDFESDVEPWIGDRLGAAILPPEDDDPEPVVVLALQVDDEEAALDTIRGGLGCAGDNSEIGHAQLDGYMLITEHPEDAERYADAAQESALTDNDEFAEAMGLLGDQGFASAWISGTGMFDAFGTSVDDLGASVDDAGTSGPDDPFAPDPDMPPLGDMRQMFEDAYRSIAFAFRFDDSYGEIASVMTGDVYTELDGAGVQADFPEDTGLMFGVANGDDYLRENWDLLFESDPATSGMLNGLGMTAGLTFPEDLGTLFGDNFVLAIDGSDLRPEALAENGPSSLEIGAKVTTDPDAAADVWEKIEAWAEWAEMPMRDVPLELTDDGYLIASSPEYNARLAEGGTLGGSEKYTTAVKDADNADVVFYLDIDAIEDGLTSMLAETGESDELMKSLRVMEAVGYSAHVHDGHTESTMRITAE